MRRWSPVSRRVSAVPAAELPVINAQLTLETVHGSLELLAELTTLFQQTAAENLRALERAIESGDAPQVRFHAHALKGASGALAGERVAAVAGGLELPAGGGNLTG